MKKIGVMAFLIICGALSSVVSAAAPPLREEICLNGQWPLGGTVPVYWGQRNRQITYQRDVSVPAGWTGKLIHLEFEKVNHIADVYVNDQLVAHHIGGWIPFSVDITRYAQPGKTFTLRVVAQAGTVPPYVDEKNHLLWPLGAFGRQDPCTGIADNVWLRAYGRTHIDDAFVQTSFRNKQLLIEYTLRNDDTVARSVHVDAEASTRVHREHRKTPIVAAGHAGAR